MRSITFNGKNSYTHYNAYICKDTKIGDVSPRTPSITVPYRNGSISAARAGGQIYYDDRELTYVFKLRASSRTALTADMSELKTWLMSSGTNTISDSTITDYHFKDCICTKITETLSEENAEGYTQIGYVTAKFSAYPLLVPDSGQGDEIL